MEKQEYETLLKVLIKEIDILEWRNKNLEADNATLREQLREKENKI